MHSCCARNYIGAGGLSGRRELRRRQADTAVDLATVGDGKKSGLSPDEVAASAATLERMAQSIEADVVLLRERDLENGTVADYLVRRRADEEDFYEVRVAVVGNVDAGKSTLLGVLTHGELDNGRGFARQKLFRHKHEMESGRTSSVGNDILGFDSKGEVVNKPDSHGGSLDWVRICENSSKVITFIDLAGHEKYLKTTVFGMTGHAPDFGMLMVGSNTNLQDLDLQTSITQISVDDDGKHIRITWSDDHESVYPSSWLWCNRFHDTAPDPVMDLPPEFWRADEIRDRLREFQFDELMTSNQVLYDWMKEIKALGLTLIKNAPQNEAALSQLGKRVGYLKDTNFGQVSSVYAPTNPKNPIYTAGNLFFHTDLTYYQQQPGIELLHCDKQFEGAGGDSTLVDGFSIKTLTSFAHSMCPSLPLSRHVNVLVRFNRSNAGRDKLDHLEGRIDFSSVVDYRSESNLDANGEPTQISYSNHSRTSVLRMPPEKVALFYRAMKLFTDLLYDQKNLYTYKMEAVTDWINNFPYYTDVKDLR
eukprot:XP_011663450.1 PREDICTED: gamma-butyrobetaine dioxygenase [Strongylocentrotus purpuratus]